MHYSDILKLNLIEGIGRKTILKLKEICIEKKLKNLDFGDLMDIINEHYGGKWISYDYDKLQIETERILEGCYNNNIIIITCFDDDFPERFNEIKGDSPALIFSKGDRSILHERCNVAIIGTRNPSESGFEKGIEYSEVMAGQGVNIISGLALGCDTAGHMGALKAGGKTLVTLPSGIGCVYPRANTRLYNEIIEKGGCIISESNPEEPPRKFDFINRDRLQAALSEGVLIIESPLSSGTVHTYNYSRKYKREIACSFHETAAVKNMELNEKIIDENTGSIIRNSKDLDEWLQKMDLEVRK
jgi:DNA processing protein